MHISTPCLETGSKLPNLFLTPLAPLIVPHRLLGLRTRRQPPSRRPRIQLVPISGPRRAPNVVVVPNLVQLGAAIVRRAPARLRLVEPGAAAAHKDRQAEFPGQRALHIGVRIRRVVGRSYSRIGQPAEGGESALPPDDCFEEVEEVLVLGCLGALGMKVSGLFWFLSTLVQRANSHHCTCRNRCMERCLGGDSILMVRILYW